MKLLSLKHPPKVQSFWRAVLVGLVAQPLSVVLLSMVYWALRPFVWAAIYSEPYRSQPGPYPPDSGEWLFVQSFGFCASVIAGALAAHWSPQRSALPIVFLVALSVGALFFMQFPLDASFFRNALYALHTPLGFVCGAVFLWRLRPRQAVDLLR